MKSPKVDERILSLLNMEQDSSADDVYAAVKSLWDDRSDANDTAGDLTHAMVAIEEALGVPPSTSTSPDPVLAKIAALKEHDARGIKNGQDARRAAGLDPHAPTDRLLASITEMRQERQTLRQVLSLNPDAPSVVVVDAIDRIRRAATSRSEMEAELSQCRVHFAKVATEVGAQPTLASVLVAIEKLKNPPKQREAAMSNAAWLAQAWDGLCQRLRISPGASLAEAVEIIDMLMALQDLVLAKLDVASTDIELFVGSVGEAIDALSVVDGQLDLLTRWVGLVELALGLDSGTSAEEAARVAESFREAANDAVGDLASLELFVERASAVREAIALLTRADARMALSIDEVSG